MQNEHISSHDNLSSSKEIRNITASDGLLLKQASEIYDVSLGQRYIPHEDLVRYASNPDSFILLGYLIDQKLIGVCWHIR